MLDDWLLFEEHITKCCKKTQKCPKEREIQCIRLVTITVISRHSWEISAKRFKVLKTLRNIQKIDPKIWHDIGAMYRVCPSRKTASDCSTQPLTA